MLHATILVALQTILCIHLGVADLENFSWDYSPILSAARSSQIQFSDLPGFTRSKYERDHALITPESTVWAGQPGWTNATTAHLISPTAATGANFVMYLANLAADGRAGPPPPGFERFVFVMDGAIQARSAAQGQPSMLDLHADSYVYFPAGECHTLRSRSGAGLLVFERRYALGAAAPEQAPPERQWGSVSDRPVLPVPGEVFLLRKLLPQTPNYDFNVHIMDFAPGEFLNVKEVHYNQHGLLLLAGQGLYRLADAWYPVQSGDAIWMAPYVVQWYAALGAHPSRYILYKDTTLDPGLY